MPDPKFFDPERPGSDFQYLEDIATGYWYSEALFAAIYLEIFDRIERHAPLVSSPHMGDDLVLDSLERFLEALSSMGLIVDSSGRWMNSAVASRYLVKSKETYMGDFLLYRSYLRPKWQGLVERLSVGRASSLSWPEDYPTRNLWYVRSQDSLARRKAEDIRRILSGINWQGPVLDIGGGAGAVSRALIRGKGVPAFLLDLPEVFDAAGCIYDQSGDWRNIHRVACDFRFSAPFKDGAEFGLIIMSNFLHAYGPDDAKEMLKEATSLLASSGHILVHDYFPDLEAPFQRGGLHDLNMMLNTYQGRCHKLRSITGWIRDAGDFKIRIEGLLSDSGILIASRGPVKNHPNEDMLIFHAKEVGFLKAVPISTDLVVVRPWVTVKCRFGCKEYAKGLMCPPHCPDHLRTQEILSSYRRALILVGEPPSARFHDMLLAVERKAFLSGRTKALVFGAGPCPVCKTCDTESGCRFPELSRPSMEASGIDVFQTAENAGIRLEPLSEKDGFVRYLGLLLVE